MQIALLLLAGLLSLCRAGGSSDDSNSALVGENIPLDQEFNSGSQAGILVGIVLGLLLLLTLLFVVHMKWVAPRHNNRMASPT